MDGAEPCSDRDFATIRRYELAGIVNPGSASAMAVKVASTRVRYVGPTDGWPGPLRRSVSTCSSSGVTDPVL